MPELAVDEGTLCVDGIGHALPAFDLLLCEDTWHARVSSSLSIVSSIRLLAEQSTTYKSADRARLGEHEATLAGSLRVVFNVQIARVEYTVRLLGRTHACKRS